MYLLPSTLMRIDERKAEPVENTRTEVTQRWRDYLALHITVGARQEVPSEALQYLINQDGRTSRYGQPVYVMQVRATEGDMGGEFRAGLLKPRHLRGNPRRQTEVCRMHMGQGIYAGQHKGTADRVVRSE